MPDTTHPDARPGAGVAHPDARPGAGVAHPDARPGAGVDAADAGLTFHHLGLASRDEGRASAALLALGYAIGPFIHDPLQGVELALATHPSLPTYEIVLARGEGGPLATLLKRDAELVYHVCFETPDREATLAALARAGARALPVSPPTPAVLFSGRLVSFHRIAGLGLVELLDQGRVA